MGHASSCVQRLLRPALVGVAAVLGAGLITAPAGALIPNDPGWRDAWGSRLVRLPAVWDLSVGSSDVVIATIDTGAYPVPDLADALVPGRDMIENDAIPRDEQGHGTAVATIIAARGDNGTGLAGVCWKCHLMPIRVAAKTEAPPSLIAAAIRWAVDHGARIVNVSLTGGGLPDPLEADAVAYAVQHDVLVVASAGNTGAEAPDYPAALPGVIAVAGTDPSDVLYPWSTRGSWVRLAAPGCQVVGAIPTGWGTLCGSSVAPAVVAGIAGLMLSLDPSLTAEDLAVALESSAVPVDGIAGGRVDAYGALVAAGLAHAQPLEPYTRQVEVETGLLSRRIDIPLLLGEGAFRAQLTSTLARLCTLTLFGGDTAITASPSGKNTVVLQTLAPEGRYVLTVECDALQPKPYELSITAMFATR